MNQLNIDNPDNDIATGGDALPDAILDPAASGSDSGDAAFGGWAGTIVAERVWPALQTRRPV